LSQVMQIARYYGGIVDVDSEPGKGSLFTFKIPVNAE
jgi:signal transduction histidine kinase